MAATSSAAGPAAQRWAEALGVWAVPSEILDAAPASPWSYPPALFARVAARALAAGGATSPSRRRALEALADGGEVLDVGVGGGAASLPLAPPATKLSGVDQSSDMLAAFATAAEARGVAHEEVQGSWPGGDIVPFVRRQLCLGPERDAEVEALLRRHGRPQLAHAVTLWWDTA